MDKRRLICDITGKCSSRELFPVPVTDLAEAIVGGHQSYSDYLASKGLTHYNLPDVSGELGLISGSVRLLQSGREIVAYDIQKEIEGFTEGTAVAKAEDLAFGFVNKQGFYYGVIDVFGENHLRIPLEFDLDKIAVSETDVRHDRWIFGFTGVVRQIIFFDAKDTVLDALDMVNTNSIETTSALFLYPESKDASGIVFSLDEKRDELIKVGINSADLIQVSDFLERLIE